MLWTVLDLCLNYAITFQSRWGEWLILINNVFWMYTVSPKKTCDYIFYNNFNNKCPIAIIFGIVSGKSMCHQNMVSFPTSPILCNYLTLLNHRTQKMTNFAVSNIPGIVLWINNVLPHVWMLEAYAETARHCSNTGLSPSPQGWQISVQSYPLVTRQWTS